MWKFRHWTPRYAFSRVSLSVYQKRHSDHPWLTKQAIWLIGRLLRPTDVGIEWGSGRSTLWFARRVARLYSVEHDTHWYATVMDRVKQARIGNVDYLLFEVAEDQQPTDMGNPYTDVLFDHPANSLDFALVDGLFRSTCAARVLERIRPGGMIILDNANWFLPCESYAPNSRTREAGPASEEWARFLAAVNSWRCIWTSNGVFDTAIWVKP